MWNSFDNSNSRATFSVRFKYKRIEPKIAMAIEMDAVVVEIVGCATNEDMPTEIKELKTLSTMVGI